MSTLYRPVKVESVEQADALPKGSVLFDGGIEDGDTYIHMGGDWRTNGYPGLLSEALDLGFTVTALVPVEAEEELVERSRLCQKDPDVLHRYVTGWQHYTAKEQNR